MKVCVRPRDVDSAARACGRIPAVRRNHAHPEGSDAPRPARVAESDGVCSFDRAGRVWAPRGGKI